MSSTQLRPTDRTRPFVAVVCAVPRSGEAMAFALDSTEVKSLSATGGDINRTLGWLRPDALIVDSEASAEEAVALAHKHELPIPRVSVQECAPCLFRSDSWDGVGNRAAPAKGIRDAAPSALVARGGPER